MEKTFPHMTFEERVAWAKGFILVAVGEGRYQQAVYIVCQQFTMWPTPPPTVESSKKRRRR